MTSSRPAATRIMLAAFLALLFTSRTLATNCYYPNGKLDDQEPLAPCSSKGGLCCPLNWECLSNGLCHLENGDLYSRNTCTDRSWNPDGDCPQICTYNNTAFGNENIKQCDDGVWCCNRDGYTYDCCSDSDRVEFDFGNPSVLATITSQQTATNVPLGSSAAPATSSSSSPTTSSTSSSSSSDSSSSSSSSKPSSSSSTSTIPPTTFTTASTMTDSAGVPTTVIITSVSQPSQTVTVAPPPHSNSTGKTVGIAVGVPVGILAFAALEFLLWRRHKKAKEANNPDPYVEASQPSDMVDMYKSPPGGGRAEIDSFPVAVAGSKPGHNNRTSQVSELSGSNRYSIQPHSPAVSSITNKEATMSPPQYSPQGNGPGGMAPVTEEPAELWGSPVSKQYPQHTQPPQTQAPQAQPPQPQDWASRRTSYPGFVPYQGSGEQQQQVPPVPEEQQHTRSTSQQYQPYRPPPAGSPGSPPPQDQGQLGGGLRVVNN